MFELATVTCPRYVLIIPDSWDKRLREAAVKSLHELEDEFKSLMAKFQDHPSWAIDRSDSGSSDSKGWSSSIAGFCVPLLFRESYKLYLLCEGCGRIPKDHVGYEITHVKEWVVKLKPVLKVTPWLLLPLKPKVVYVDGLLSVSLQVHIGPMLTPYTAWLILRYAHDLRCCCCYRKGRAPDPRLVLLIWF